MCSARGRTACLSLLEFCAPVCRRDTHALCRYTPRDHMPKQFLMRQIHAALDSNIRSSAAGHAEPRVLQVFYSLPALETMKRARPLCASQLEDESGDEQDGLEAGAGADSSAAVIEPSSQPESEHDPDDGVPLGPASFEELFAWPERFMQKVVRNEQGSWMLRNLRTCTGIVLTTSFSGIGSAEVAASMVANHLCKMGIWHGDALQVYSACEIDVSCQGVLLSHAAPCRPKHVFTDIQHILPHGLEQELRELSGSLRKQLSEMQFSGSQQRQEAVKTLAEHFHCRAVLALQDVVVQSQAYCAIHRRPCPCVPKAPIPGTYLRVEVAGSPCVAFCKGAYGSQEGFLHETAVCFTAWTAKVRHDLPHIVLHECVPGFQAEILIRYLNAGCPPEKPFYVMQSVVWNVLDEGFPVSRERRYTVCVRAEHAPPLFSLEDNWHDVMSATCCLTADVFLRASQTDMDLLREEWACSRNLPAKRRNSKGQLANWAWQALMLPSSRDLLRVLQLQAEEMQPEWEREFKHFQENDLHSTRVVMPDRKPVFRWLANLSQSLAFQPRLVPMRSSHMPALLRSSRFFVSSNVPEFSRPVHPMEVFSMQGLPVYLPENSPVMIPWCNMEDVLRRAMAQCGVRLKDLDSMAVNGMNVSAIGQLLLFALCVHMWDPPPDLLALADEFDGANERPPAELDGANERPQPTRDE